MRAISSCILLAVTVCIVACAAVAPPAPVQTPAKNGIARDPVEKDPRYAEIFATIDAEVKEALKYDPLNSTRGSVHLYWDMKKSILKNKYGIDWRSPGEMNPHIIFD